MGTLTKNFSLSEFACPCCGVRRMTATIQRNLRRLAEGLQLLRDVLGKPVRITSGYRCPSRNRVVGGVPNSQHVLGLAADVVVDGLTPTEVAQAAAKIAVFRIGGIGVYHSDGFTHLDVRGWIARWEEK